MSVDEVRTYKPSPAAYQLAVIHTGVDKGSIGFVSSNYWDVAGAKSFGFKSYWIDRSGAAADELGVRPDASLRSLSELADLVDAQ
jgi:2-haloacid dehalogenase